MAPETPKRTTERANILWNLSAGAGLWQVQPFQPPITLQLMTCDISQQI